MQGAIQYSAPVRPAAIVKGAIVQLKGSPGTYRVREIRHLSVEVEHVVTGAPAGIWPLDVTIPVQARPQPEGNANV